MKLSNLAKVLRAAGLTVQECPGWATRGYAGQDLTEVRGVLWHHTATNRAAFARADAPTLNMCVNGRPDLPGPLCQIVLGRNGTVYLVAAGLANHAGTGSAPGIPDNTGNRYLIGIEMESSGIAPWDWTTDQLRVAPHLGAALEREYLSRLPADLRLQLGHLEYSDGGKIDPAGWPGGMDGLRASINKVLATAPKPPAPSKPGAPGTVTVKAGDTLSKIAERVGTSWQELARINNLANPNTIKPGQVLKTAGAKPSKPRKHTVKGGETLSGIAAKYGTTWQALASLNHLSDPNLLRPGQVLTIP